MSKPAESVAKNPPITDTKITHDTVLELREQISLLQKKNLQLTDDIKIAHDTVFKLREKISLLQKQNLQLTDDSTIFRKYKIDSAIQINELHEKLNNLESVQEQNQELIAQNTQLRVYFEKFKNFKDRLEPYVNEYHTPEATPFKSRSTASLTATASASASSESAANLNISFPLEPHSPIDRNHSHVDIPSSPALADIKETFEDKVIKTLEKFRQYLRDCLNLNADLKNDLDNAISHNTKFEEHIKSLEDQISRINQEHTATLELHKKKQENTIMKIKAHYEDELSELKMEITRLRSALSEKSKTLSASQEQFNTSIKERDNSIEALKQLLRQKEQALTEKTSQIIALRTEELEREKKLDDERTKNSSTHEALKKSSKRASQKLEQLGTLESVQIPQLQANIKQLEQRNTELMAEITRLRSLSDEMNEFRVKTESAYNKQIVELKYALQALNADHQKALDTARSAHENALGLLRQKSEAEIQTIIFFQRQQQINAESVAEQANLSDISKLTTGLQNTFSSSLQTQRDTFNAVIQRHVEENATLRISQTRDRDANVALTRENETLRRELDSLRREMASRKSANDVVQFHHINGRVGAAMSAANAVAAKEHDEAIREPANGIEVARVSGMPVQVVLDGPMQADAPIANPVPPMMLDPVVLQQPIQAALNQNNAPPPPAINHNIVAHVPTQSVPSIVINAPLKKPGRFDHRRG